MHDLVELKGTISLALYGPDGNLKTERTLPNLIVQTGKNYIASRLIGDPSAATYFMGVGSSSTAVASSQLVLGSQVGSRQSATATRTNSELTFSSTFAPGVSTDTLREAAIFTDPTNTTTAMINRAVFPDLAKEAGDTLVINWNILIN